jgi:hypothetical protein
MWSFFMDDAVKETKNILRLVQEHLTELRRQQGALSEQANQVDIFYHPTSTLPELNMLTLRKNTAWVSPKELAAGFEKLRRHQRNVRIEYLDGLYPPRFGETLQQLGLVLERSTALLVYQTGAKSFKVPAALDGVHISPVNDAQGGALWWYVWRNSYYDVVTTTADPVFIGQDLRKISEGTQIDLVMYRYRLPVGVVRVNLHKTNKTAQIVAMTIMKEIRSEASVWLLLSHAVQAAIKQGCTFIFASTVTEEIHKLYREHDFIDYGRVVCYAEKQQTSCEDTNIAVAQPIPSH